MMDAVYSRVLKQPPSCRGQLMRRGAMPDPDDGGAPHLRRHHRDLLDSPLWLGLLILTSIISIACAVALLKRTSRKCREWQCIVKCREQCQGIVKCREQWQRIVKCQDNDCTGQQQHQPKAGQFDLRFLIIEIGNSQAEHPVAAKYRSEIIIVQPTFVGFEASCLKTFLLFLGVLRPSRLL